MKNFINFIDFPYKVGDIESRLLPYGYYPEEEDGDNDNICDNDNI